MKCCRCPLYHYWSNESDRGEECAIFGDGWDSPFQYEDKEGTIIGCYLDRHYIEKVDSVRDEYYASMAESMARQLKTEATISKMEQVDEPQRLKGGKDVHEFCKGCDKSKARMFEGERFIVCGEASEIPCICMRECPLSRWIAGDIYLIKPKDEPQTEDEEFYAFFGNMFQALSGQTERSE